MAPTDESTEMLMGLNGSQIFMMFWSIRWAGLIVVLLEVIILELELSRANAVLLKLNPVLFIWSIDGMFLFRVGWRPSFIKLHDDEMSL